jgi:DMSO reductase anchor subunit
MKSERYQILSLAYTGQLAPEEAELRLNNLGKRERRVFRLILSAAAIVAVAAIVIVFHLEDKIRLIAMSAIQAVEGSTIFREVSLFSRRVIDAL